jgi:hypothetical protein
VTSAVHDKLAGRIRARPSEEEEGKNGGARVQSLMQTNSSPFSGVQVFVTMTSTALTAQADVNRHAPLDRAIADLWPTAYRLAFLVLRDRMAAEDVAQESCIRALRGTRGLRDDAALQSWFRTIVLRLSLSAQKRIQRTRRQEEAFGTQVEPSMRCDARSRRATILSRRSMGLMMPCDFPSS